MATIEFQYIQDVLKDWYAPAIINQVYTKSPVWSQVKKTSKGVSGKRVYIPLRKTLSEAVGPLRATENTLHTASGSGYDSTYIWQKRNYGRIQLDGLSMASSKGKGGWVDQFKAESMGISEANAIEIDQQVMGRGTGILGVADAANSTTTINVNDPHGISEDAPVYMWFRPNMLLQIWDVGTHAFLAAANDEMTVESIDPANGQFEVVTAPSTSLADGDFLCRKGAGSFDSSDDTYIDAKNTGPGDIMGIDRIVDNDQTDFPGDDITYFQGIAANSTNNPWWRGTVNSTRGILTETKIQEDLDLIESNTDADTPNLALTTKAIRNKLVEIVKSNVVMQTLNLVGGWEAIKYRGGSTTLPIMVHKFCPTGYIYYLNLKYLKYYTLKKLEWDTSMGGILKQVANEDAYEAFFKMYGNLGTDKRNSMGKGIGYTV